MPYIFGKLWHLAIIWAIRKAFQCILQGVRFLLANHTRLFPTSENDSYQDCSAIPPPPPTPLCRFFTKKSCGTRMAKNGPKKAKTRLMTFFTRNMNTEQLLLRKKNFGSKVSLHSWAVWLNYVSSQSSSYIVHAKKSNEESGGRFARSFWCFVLIIREPVLLSTRIGCRSVFSGFCGELSRIIRAGDTSPTLPSIVY